MRRYLRKLLLLILPFLLFSCGRDGLAPVVELQPYQSSTKKEHIVSDGETLYTIAFRYDKDYRDLALINHLPKPYTLRVGQKLYLISNPTKSFPIVINSPKELSGYKSSISSWAWPAVGKVVTMYSPLRGNKGIDIAGKKGARIYAVRDGTVAYSGNGLSGYGNLIIIKHDKQYLTAYGNNTLNLVKEGQKVRKGQVIAVIGIVNRKFWGLHFEIRKAGKPVNPLLYLNSRN